MSNKIVFIGGGGHSLVCYDVLCQNKDLNLIGFIDIKQDVVLKKVGCKYLGNDRVIKSLIKKDYFFFNAIGQIKTPEKRIETFKKIINSNGQFTTLISKNSFVSPMAKLGQGTILMNGCIVNAKSIIEENCIINTNAVIEHEVKIEPHVHIAPNATILGNVTIKSGSFIGAGAIIREGLTIQNNSVIPAGEKVMKSN